MKIDGHYDERADIAWLRFEGYDPNTVVAEETEFGLREIDPADRRLVGLEYWHASKTLPADLLKMLPSPPIAVAG
jgi:uncharacterized protein YuzE